MPQKPIRKVLLIVPPTGLYIREDRCQTPLEHMTTVALRSPIDLLYAGACFEQGHVPNRALRPGASAPAAPPLCRLVDYPGEGLGEERLAADIREFQPDLVLMSITTPGFDDDMAVAALIKREAPGAIVAAKGAHFNTLDRDALARHRALDVALRGEFEPACRELAEGRTWGEIAGLTFRSAEDEIVRTPDRPFIEDLDSLPFPTWRSFSLSSGIMSVLTARGCPFNCNFCMRVLGSKVRFRSPESIIAELKYLIEEFGAAVIDFVDETFTLNRKRLEKLLRMMLAEELHKKVEWTVQTHVGAVDFEILSLMKQAGCVRVGLGIESGNAEILRQCGKGITLEQAETAVKAAKRAGLKVNGFFILGHPNENRRTVRDTVRFAVKLNPDFAAFGIMVPYPGTRIRDIALRGEGGYTWVSSNWEDYRKNAGRPMEMKEFSAQTLVKLQMKAYLVFYLRNLRLYDLMKLFVQNSKVVFRIMWSWMRRRKA